MTLQMVVRGSTRYRDAEVEAGTVPLILSF